MTAWLLISLSLMLQLPNSNNAANSAKQSLEAPRFWIQTAEKESGAEPNQLRLTIQTSALPAVGAAQFDLVFEPDQLKHPELVAGKLLGNALLESNLVAPGRLRAAFVSSEPLSGPGELAVLQGINSDSASSPTPIVRLENVKAWKSADSSELTIELGQSQQPEVPPTVASLPNKPDFQPNSEKSPTSSAPTSTEDPHPTNLHVTLNGPLNVRLELPGWWYFIAGSLTTLIAGALCWLVLRRN